MAGAGRKEAGCGLRALPRCSSCAEDRLGGLRDGRQAKRKGQEALGPQEKVWKRSWPVCCSTKSNIIHLHSSTPAILAFLLRQAP